MKIPSNNPQISEQIQKPTRLSSSNHGVLAACQNKLPGVIQQKAFFIKRSFFR